VDGRADTTFAGPWVEIDNAVTVTEHIPPTAEERVEARRGSEIDGDRHVIPVGNDRIPQALYDEVSATPRPRLYRR
jgi:hypothetical protein